ACLSALWAREKTGQGQQVDVSMLDGVLPLMTLQMAHYQATKLTMGPGEQPLSGGLACYGVYACADGRYVALGLLEEKFWKLFCDLVQRPDWLDQHLVLGEEADSLRREMAALFRTKPRDEWIAAAKDLDVCLTPVCDLAELENDPHLLARRMIYEEQHPVCGNIKSVGVPLKFSATPAKPAGPAPALGRDTKAVLEEIGYDARDIAALCREGIVVVSDPG
ncbi:MAG: CaiB/BaiF CoA-transferase family protein, partial [Smithellaceae bacterium]|nr:CaiB/BaiF CoA-transferase family protein [Smithellaceae bacterium]